MWYMWGGETCFPMFSSLASPAPSFLLYPICQLFHFSTSPLISFPTSLITHIPTFSLPHFPNYPHPYMSPSPFLHFSDTLHFHFSAVLLTSLIRRSPILPFCFSLFSHSHTHPVHIISGSSLTRCLSPWWQT